MRHVAGHCPLGSLLPFSGKLHTIHCPPEDGVYCCSCTMVNLSKSLYFIFHWLHCWCCTLPTTILYLTVWQWTPSSLLLSTWEPSCWLQSAFLDNIPKTMTNWLWWFWNQKSFGKSFVYDLYSQQQCLIFKRQAQSLGTLSFPGHGQIEKIPLLCLSSFDCSIRVCVWDSSGNRRLVLSQWKWPNWLLLLGGIGTSLLSQR